jgi:hypothetical protein
MADDSLVQPAPGGNRHYVGRRTPEGCIVEVIDASGTRPLDPRLDLHNHSPTGLEWGYGGSGPAQLALALAADMLGDDDRALSVYQRLKWKIVGGLPHDSWTLTEDRLRHTIEQIEREQSHPLPPT